MKTVRHMSVYIHIHADICMYGIMNGEYTDQNECQYAFNL